MDARGKRGNFAILYLTLISVCREREKSFFGGKETRVTFSRGFAVSDSSSKRYVARSKRV